MASLPKGWEKTKDEGMRPSGRKINYRNRDLDDGGFVQIRKSSSPAVIDAGEAGKWRVSTSMYSQDSVHGTKREAVKRAKQIMRAMNRGEWSGGLF